MPSKKPKKFEILLIENLAIPKKKQAYLPKGFQRIGHIVILNLRPQVRDFSTNLAKIILNNYPYVKTVCITRGVSGELREPKVKWLAGERKTETIHRENQCLFKLDVTKVMFSKGNLSERGRLPNMVRTEEVVADLFAGIGYFSIPIAKLAKPKKVYAIEKNPVSFKYLNENLRLNRVQDRITPILGDCRKVKMGNIADRVIMGYLPKTYAFLPTAFETLKPQGGIIHYHDTFSEKELWERPKEILEAQAFRAGYALKSIKHKSIVKEYAPRVYHVVIDAEFRPA
jgi:tRNA wybutosine-synthesizing protein 2